MKKAFLIFLILLSINCVGQKKTEKVNGIQVQNQDTANDFAIKVIYKENKNNANEAAFFLNGKLIDQTALRTIDPKNIEKVDVKKGEFEIENVKFSGKILIQTIEKYNPIWISLNNLKLKHTSIKNDLVIFKIDDNIINTDYDKAIVDENYLLRIIIEDFENKNDIKLKFIKLITKSEENIKKSKQIIVRGDEELY